MRLFRHPWWQHLDYRVKVATTQENKPPTQGTRQWTFTTPRWRCGSILLPSLNTGVPEATGGRPRALVAYGSGKRMVTGTRAGSRIKTRNFKRRFLPHHKSQRRDIWCTNSPVLSCFNPEFVDRSMPYEAKQRCVKFRRCFGNIPSEFR